MLRRYASCVSMAIAFALQGFGQWVISAHSGLILAAEGTVFVDDSPVNHSPGHLSELPQSSILRTLAGKAEILLTPGVVLRIGENSAVRMLSNALVDTQVEFLQGTVIVETINLEPENSVTVFYDGHPIQMREKGSYRLDSEPNQVRVNSGTVNIAASGDSISVADAHVMSFPSRSVAVSLTHEPDAFDLWSERRSRLDALAAAPPKPPENSKNRRTHIWSLRPRTFPARTFFSRTASIALPRSVYLFDTLEALD